MMMIGMTMFLCGCYLELVRNGRKVVSMCGGGSGGGGGS